jgi:hypothetical protein
LAFAFLGLCCGPVLTNLRRSASEAGTWGGCTAARPRKRFRSSDRLQIGRGFLAAFPVDLNLVGNLHPFGETLHP